jgi:hypothetical protein
MMIRIPGFVCTIKGDQPVTFSIDVTGYSMDGEGNVEAEAGDLTFRFKDPVSEAKSKEAARKAGAALSLVPTVEDKRLAKEFADGPCGGGKDRIEDAGCVEDLAHLLAEVRVRASGAAPSSRKADEDAFLHAYNLGYVDGADLYGGRRGDERWADQFTRADDSSPTKRKEGT